MNNKKVLVGFYKGEIEPYLERLENFEKAGYEVHVFDNVDDNNINQFDINNIIDNTFENTVKKENINLISNIEQLIINLYEKFTFVFNGFIYDNTLEQEKNIQKVKKEKAEVRENLYSFKEWNIDTHYTVLTNTDIKDLSVKNVREFIEMINLISKAGSQLADLYGQLEYTAKELKNTIETLSHNEKKAVEIEFEQAYENMNIISKIYLGSFLLITFKERKYGEMLIDTIRYSDVLNKNNKFSLMYQIISKGFTDSSIAAATDFDKLHSMYDDIFEEFKKATGVYNHIPKEERNENVICIFTSQFLTLEHGPTKTALDRCYALAKYLNKKVILINTKELMSKKGLMLFNSMCTGNINPMLNGNRKIQHKDIIIDYYQPEIEMPDETACKDILEFIKKEKPYLLFNIGGYSITADLAAQMVPMATISTSGNYAISKNKGQFFIMGRKPEESDYELIAKEGHPRESIIECPFTFELKPQKENYTREDFNIPKDKFVVGTVGARLPREITEEFIIMLDKLARKNCFIVTIGEYNFSEEILNKYSDLAKNHLCMGFQNDILACVELFDLYVNPKRQGGGTSAVECMFKGKPALSLKVGDVSMLVDEKFLVDSFDEMIDMAEKLRQDNKFYSEMSKRAQVKAADLMDTKTYFIKMYNDVINSPIFN